MSRNRQAESLERLNAEWPPTVPPADGWRDLAECRGVPTDLFYDNAVAVPMSMCEVCPVRRDCLAAAFDDERTIEMRGILGVRGGTIASARHQWWAEHRSLRLRDDFPTLGSACGSERGYGRHRRAGETPCAECKAAHAAYARERTNQ